MDAMAKSYRYDPLSTLLHQRLWRSVEFWRIWKGGFKGGVKFDLEEEIGGGEEKWFRFLSVGFLSIIVQLNVLFKIFLEFEEDIRTKSF